MDDKREDNLNKTEDNVEENSNFCSFLGIDNISTNSIPFTNEDLHAKKALEDIKTVIKQTMNIKNSIDHFRGKVNDQEYLFLEDTLLKLNMKLDSIESDGNDVIKDQRKNAVNFVEKCLKLLDAKANKEPHSADSN